ncbi:hypothetical protein PtA15_8A315 [Puccinia triticina]|uniref:Uncharacterized protein n=1 Tax=Puccinia triticina TaxID=208348 RepID=A0ABY7CQ83_9BASI|nr:uncharacterized protein PtA15_8A315 [Puccinia triticina]WAQ87411.1 hypothetical protein PtA15_8A315 [Puccinia triticina]
MPDFFSPAASFLIPSSPLPPASSAYALSLTRNTGTPTSDLRATSPANCPSAAQPAACFWAILDHQPSLLFLDPARFPQPAHPPLRLDQLLPPADLAQLKARLPSLLHPPQPPPPPALAQPAPDNALLVGQPHSSPCPPFRTTPCGLDQATESDYLSSPEESYLLQRALEPPPPPAFFPSDDPHAHSFLIFDARNAAVLFAHRYASNAHIEPSVCPEDYAYFAMQSKAAIDSSSNSTEHSTCARELTAQHRLVKDGMAINIVQSFVIEYGSVTFASFKTVPSSRPSTMSSSQQQPPPSGKPSPLELVHDAHPALPLDLYSPTSSSQLAHKRPRTDSCSEALTPQSACSTHSQAFSYTPQGHLLDPAPRSAGLASGYDGFALHGLAHMAASSNAFEEFADTPAAAEAPGHPEFGPFAFAKDAHDGPGAASTGRPRHPDDPATDILARHQAQVPRVCRPPRRRSRTRVHVVRRTQLARVEERAQWGLRFSRAQARKAKPAKGPPAKKPPPPQAHSSPYHQQGQAQGRPASGPPEPALLHGNSTARVATGDARPGERLLVDGRAR